MLAIFDNTVVVVDEIIGTFANLTRLDNNLNRTDQSFSIGMDSLEDFLDGSRETEQLVFGVADRIANQIIDWDTSELSDEDDVLDRVWELVM